MFPGTTILNYLFWMVLGALQVLVIIGMHEWFKSYKKNISWWQTAIMYMAFLSFCTVIAGGFTLMGEYESIAGWYFIGVLGLPVIIGSAIAFRLFIMKKPSKVVPD